MMITDFAAHTLEEANLIAAILKSYSSPEPFAQYAEWLRPKQEEIATYIEQLGRGVRPKATPSVSSKSWVRLFGIDQPWANFRSELPVEMLGAIEEWVRPVVVLTASSAPDSELPIGCSKFRGYPDLPASVDWPTCEWASLHFHAQINLADLQLSQASLRYGIPKTGLLLLFAMDDSQYGVQPGVVTRNPQTNAYEEVPNLTYLLYISADNKLERRTPPKDAIVPEGPWSCHLSASEGCANKLSCA